MVSLPRISITNMVDLLSVHTDASRPWPKFAEDALRRASKTVVERLHTHSRGALLSRLSKIGAQIEGSRTRRTLVRLSDTGALRRGSRYPAHYNKAHDGRRSYFLAHEGRRSAVEAHM